LSEILTPASYVRIKINNIDNLRYLFGLGG